MTDQPVHTQILTAVIASGAVLMLDLATAVGRTVGMGREEVIAAVWDLVHDDRLTYSADARVRLP
jgi:hypothetical protein